LHFSVIFFTGIQKRQESSFSAVGLQSPCPAAGEDNRGTASSFERENLRRRVACPSAVGSEFQLTETMGAAGRTTETSSPKFRTCEAEVESFFHQLWHIPWHLAKVRPRVSTIKKGTRQEE
jgi:hypothetical protein